MYDLGYRIKEIRTQRGITQSELAKRINKSKSAVSGYESNAQIPPSEVLVSIATVLNVSLDYLVGFDMEEPISLKNFNSQQKKRRLACLWKNLLIPLILQQSSQNNKSQSSKS